MNRSRMATMTMLLSLAVSAYAANPFLNAQDDKPVFAKFRGAEWSDDIGKQDIPLGARVATTRMAKMPWGAIFKNRIHLSQIERSKAARHSARLLYCD